ncbi:serine/threonine-protein phosphatase 2B catalytic subunit gamma isoform [Reticulomyxa filosa]|uniref:Serine/threonine-protein phosphatase 2B catalytic subunit gamma isoform n=1 Tax=Reticulomyxa filosa TaxID=46433 RepID=X6M7Q4_RETFI|nr:serine/threonine-protein phosphatase 2B catalytic subunit gamma isoform [Reticulomyxa filosa]|eukprot:ETO10013.1 serine/threonine-protein phosphatase 2B catalytic subunit gamma isoform [Reticulomyxa filosa]
MQFINEQTSIPRVITIFSAPNYCDVYKNKGACLKFDDELLNIRNLLVRRILIICQILWMFLHGLPFVAEKVTDMLYSILSYGIDTDAAVKAQGPSEVVRKKGGVLKDKVVSVTKLMRMYRVLKENQNNIIQLKQLSVNYLRVYYKADKLLLKKLYQVLMKPNEQIKQMIQCLYKKKIQNLLENKCKSFIEVQKIPKHQKINDIFQFFVVILLCEFWLYVLKRTSSSKQLFFLTKIYTIIFFIFSSKYSKKSQLRHYFLHYILMKSERVFFLLLSFLSTRKEKKNGLFIFFYFFFDIMNCLCFDHSLSPSSKEKKVYPLLKEKLGLKPPQHFKKIKMRSPLCRQKINIPPCDKQKNKKIRYEKVGKLKKKNKVKIMKKKIGKIKNENRNFYIKNGGKKIMKIERRKKNEKDKNESEKKREVKRRKGSFPYCIWNGGVKEPQKTFNIINLSNTCGIRKKHHLQKVFTNAYTSRQQQKIRSSKQGEIENRYININNEKVGWRKIAIIDSITQQDRWQMQRMIIANEEPDCTKRKTTEKRFTKRRLQWKKEQKKEECGHSLELPQRCYLRSSRGRLIEVFVQFWKLIGQVSAFILHLQITKKNNSTSSNTSSL